MTATVVEIPLNGDLAAQNFIVSLDGISYRMFIEWNGRTGAWYFGISDNGGNDILRGIKCVPNYPLTRQYRIENLPTGMFMVHDSNGVNDMPGRDTFGSGRRFKLLYIVS